MDLVVYFLLFSSDLFGDFISSMHLIQYSEVASWADGIVRHGAAGSWPVSVAFMPRTWRAILVCGVCLGTLQVPCVRSATKILLSVQHSGHVSAYRMLSTLGSTHRATSVARSASVIK
jgi:hypothetical protein